MAEGKLKSNLTLIIAILGLVIALVVMLFGDNLFGRSRSTELSITTSQNEFQLPDKLNQVILNNIDSSELKLIPDTIRLTTLKNVGSTSRQLRILITLDGPIYQHKITSTEEVEAEFVDENKVKLTMKRLSKNAELSMIFWVRNDNKAFNATYADDNKSGTINVNSLYNPKESYLNSISILLSLISVSLIFYELIKRMIGRFKTASLDNNKDLINEMMDLYLNANVDKTNISETQELVDTEVQEQENTKEKLSEMMDRLKQARISG